MKVLWTPEAERDRLAIWDYLEARDPGAALRMDHLFSDAAAGLVDFPMLGHEGVVLARVRFPRIAATGSSIRSLTIRSGYSP